ncbi:MAG: hypothetical protein RMH84_04110, partial [Sulfolobales archaeon]|nr:hypothetical protein [Sulfolobales archaeon]
PLITVSAARGTPVRIEVLGTGLTDVVLYDVVAPTVTLDRKEYPYRRDAVVRIDYTDTDADYDPTKMDTLPATCVLVDITLIKADGRTFSTSTHLGALGAASSTEPTVRGGRFSYSVLVSKIGDALGQPIGKDDRVLLSFRTSDLCQGGVGWADPATVAEFKAVYRYPKVSVTRFDQQLLVVDIESPDDNVNTAVADTLDPGATVTIAVAPGVGSVTIGGGTVRETGPNTNIFRVTIPVTWGVTGSITPTLITLPRSTAGPFTATIRYYREDPRPGYSIDVSGSGSYAPRLPTITVDKASVKVIIATVTKPDLNNLPGSIEVLRGTAIITTGKFDVRLDRDGVYLARLRIFDKTGALVDIKPGFAVGDVTMVETDFNTGVFVLRIPAEYVDIVAGETYTLDYCDFAGFVCGIVRVTFRVDVISITIDRAEYPAAFGATITVHVDYSNDLYNRDPTRRETVSVSYRLVASDGTTVLGTGAITLTETDVDTGLFRVTASITIPDRDEIIEGKLEVFDPARPEAKAEAKFRLYDGRLSVSPARIRMATPFTITIEDADLNRNSRAVEEFTLTIRSDRCPTISVTMRETGVNTGVFTGSVTYHRGVCGTAAAPDRIYVSYTDVRQRPLVVGYARYTVTLSATIPVDSVSGTLDVKTAEPDKISIIEEFTITVTDPDMNVHTGVVNTLTIYVIVEGVHTVTPATLDLTETGVNTGVFTRKLRLSDIPGVLPGIKELAKLIGRKVIVMYTDEADATGTRALVSRTLTVVAYDPVLSISPPTAVNIGEELTITVVDRNRVGAGRVDVMVKSTIYPIPISFPATEVSPGTFVYKVRVVEPAVWSPGAPEVPARLGDTIEVIYIAPVNAKGETDVVLTKSVPVGRPVERPGRVVRTDFLDETGAVVTPRVGKLTFITITVRNDDIVTRTMTLLVVVRDPAGVAVAMYYAVVTLAPGASQPVGFGWTPITHGAHRVEIYIVVSLADRTPLGDPATVTVTVVK